MQSRIKAFIKVNKYIESNGPYSAMVDFIGRKSELALWTSYIHLNGFKYFYKSLINLFNKNHLSAHSYMVSYILIQYK